MRLENHITEIFNKKPTKVRIVKDEAANFGVEFASEDDTFVVKAIKCNADGKWEVGFGLEQNFVLWPDKPKCLKVKVKKSDRMMGSSTEAFSGVIDGVEKFVKKKKPEAFYFRTDDPKRKSLYKRFITKFRKKFKEYDFTVEVVDGDDGHTYFEFVKTGKRKPETEQPKKKLALPWSKKNESFQTIDEINSMAWLDDALGCDCVIKAADEGDASAFISELMSFNGIDTVEDLAACLERTVECTGMVVPPGRFTDTVAAAYLRVCESGKQGESKKFNCKAYYKGELAVDTTLSAGSEGDARNSVAGLIIKKYGLNRTMFPAVMRSLVDNPGNCVIEEVKKEKVKKRHIRRKEKQGTLVSLSRRPD